jgi:PHD/YefM family antitoxin component YafN of YafNO toxin-antitoxin module
MQREIRGMSRTIDVGTVGRDLAAIVSEVSATQDCVVVEKDGAPAAVILSFVEYEQMLASSPRWWRDLQLAAARSGAAGFSEDDIEAEIQAARLSRRKTANPNSR